MLIFGLCSEMILESLDEMFEPADNAILKEFGKVRYGGLFLCLYDQIFIGSVHFDALGIPVGHKTVRLSTQI